MNHLVVGKKRDTPYSSIEVSKEIAHTVLKPSCRKKTYFWVFRKKALGTFFH
jgi:hypothetical protein